MDSSAEDLVARARDIATCAHAGQADKSGVGYITHPERVASRLESPDAKVVGYLHDVVEDTHITADDLRESFPDHIVEAVVAISQLPNERRLDYYARVKENSLAHEVKLADIADNMSPARMARLDRRTQTRLMCNYREALEVLGEAPSQQ